MLNVAVFVSGRGSNLKSLNESVTKEKIRICAVVSDKENCGAVSYALDNQIPVFLVSQNNSNRFFSYGELLNQFLKINIDLIVLAGYLKKIPDNIIDEYENRIINIHPALLPKFGGKGMYGINVHKAVFDSSEKISGATVHFVDKIYDNGKIIAQSYVDISELKGPDEIADKVLIEEHKLLPFVVNKFADKKIVINQNRIIIAD